MTPTAARVIYPELPDPLTPGDLQQLFSPSFDEREWAPTVTRTVESQVALLVQLKIFQTTGRFRRSADVPPAAADHRFAPRSPPWAQDAGILQLNATEIVQFLILVLIVRCRWYANAMIVATKPEAAPTAIAHLGPNTSATQPTRGAPRGVQPRKMAI